MADEIRITEAVILCGGMGTRLRGVVKDVPKPLADIAGEPFLSVLMRYLKTKGIERVILATGYMHEKIESVYGNSFAGMEVDYSIEASPLGTGGAMAKALSKVRGEYALVTNGDSVIRFDLDKAEKQFLEDSKANDFAPETVLFVLKQMQNVDRYGAVVLQEDKIKAFEEKSFREKCLINAGVYLLSSQIFAHKAQNEPFSFEKDFLEHKVKEGFFHGMVSEGFFIDIGVPEDYARAQKELKQNLF